MEKNYPALARCFSLAASIDIEGEGKISTEQRKNAKKVLSFLLDNSCTSWPSLEIQESQIIFEWKKEEVIFRYEVPEEWKELELESISRILLEFED